MIPSCLGVLSTMRLEMGAKGLEGLPHAVALGELWVPKQMLTVDNVGVQTQGQGRSGLGSLHPY